ncbi:YrhB domain-containing protein [Agrococcus jejuensis]|uniref:Immunity protein 35 n=1 Tax=Agrococcus jejuensis TaxID=399736 RepID=A0A1G8EV17_9MICO|nr:YrhB domain-containing protein [Agrococcus jejuensis]SDH73733.1 Immunity protein 35 [Agrococcus jejuensis]
MDAEREASPGISRERALEIVRLMLDALEAQSGARYAIFDGERGIDGILDHGDVWIVVWNAADFVATGDARRMLIGAGPYLVAKDDGAVAMLPSAFPVDEGVSRWRASRGR